MMHGLVHVFLTDKDFSFKLEYFVSEEEKAPSC